MQLTNRNTAFHSLKTIRLNDDCLQQLRKGRIVKSIPLSEITHVNLAFLGASQAGQGAAPAYRCLVKGSNGRSIEMRNVLYQRFTEIASINMPYMEMVVQLHERLADRSNEGVRFSQGSNAFYWLGWLGVLMCALLVLMVPCLLLIEGGQWAVLRKSWAIGLMPLFLSTSFLPLIRRGRSQPYQPTELPLDHLPVEGYLHDLKNQ